MNRPDIIFIILLTIFTVTIPTPSKAQQDNTTLEPIGVEAFEVMREFFNYDRDIPLNVKIVSRDEESEYIREKIVFRGIRDSRVPGYLAVPKDSAESYPCILLLHGIGGSKEGWWKDNSSHHGGQLTKQLLASGIAVLALDAEYHGERLANNDFESPLVFTLQKGWLLRTRDMVVQSVIEHRRAIDYLDTRSEIDASRIGLIGYSMGGMMAFTLGAVEPRIKTSVACVLPIIKAPHSALAVQNFAPYIQSQPFLMLMGTEDKFNYTTEDAQQLFDFIKSDAKEIKFYKGGHQLPVEWTKRAVEWVNGNLK